jgi:hypothetical protein
MRLIVSSPSFRDRGDFEHARDDIYPAMTHAMDLEALDRDFLRRTVRTTLGLGAVLTAWLVQTLQMPLLGGFAAGVLIGAGGLAATTWAVDRATARTGRWLMLPVAVMLGKLVALYFALWVLVWRFEFSALALAAGVSLVLAVIVLKVAGRRLTPAGAGIR